MSNFGVTFPCQNQHGKIYTLSKLLSLFQSITLRIKSKNLNLFISLDNWLDNLFFYMGKSARVLKTLLQQCKRSSGLSLPNVKLYPKTLPLSSVYKLDLSSCKASSLHALLYSLH